LGFQTFDDRRAGSRLKKIYGPYNLIRYPESVSSAEQIAEMARGCDVIAVVLPFDILISLVELIGDEKPIIRSQMKADSNVKIGGSKDDKPYKHLRWERIIEARLVTEKLLPRGRTIAPKEELSR